MKWNSTLDVDIASADVVEELALIVANQIQYYALNLRSEKKKQLNEEENKILNCAEFIRYHFLRCVFDYTEYLKEYDNVCRYIVEEHGKEPSDKSEIGNPLV